MSIKPLFDNVDVQQKFEQYPADILILLMKIRAILIQVATEDNIGNVTETLKWGEPSYLVKGGSTIRIDWNPKFPTQYRMYFNCKSSLIETFKEVYSDVFTYEGNRAIVFDLEGEIPSTELKHCISLAFRYHKIKHLPLLGV